MRLIDADAFEKVIRNKLPLGLFMKRTIPSAMKTMGELVEELEKVPTIDQWHYPSKGEYPTVGLFNPYMSDKCLVYVDEDGINKHLDMAYYDFREKGWVKFPVPAREEWLNVCAWQLIEPPKEEA